VEKPEVHEPIKKFQARTSSMLEAPVLVKIKTIWAGALTGGFGGKPGPEGPEAVGKGCRPELFRILRF